MSGHFLYLIGEPGVGKSTLFEYLTRELPYEEALTPFAHRVYDCGVWELGRRRENFSGTDALSMSVQPKVEQLLEGIHPKLVMAEGDRLANDRFYKYLAGVDYQLWLYELWGPKVAMDRRLARGSNQHPNWLRGRMTKVERLAQQWGAIPLDAVLPVDAHEELMQDPVAQMLKVARAAQEALTPSEGAPARLADLMDAAGLEEFEA
jgi:energy-coupling factor transporter ATP-binding protein EcfA2